MKIFVNGSFDLLHTGHIELLNYAKSLGTHLLVAIDTDERVTALKGVERPLNPFHVRKCIMKNLKAVDHVTSFNSDIELIELIKNYSPDIMVKGSDWQGHKIIGSEYAKKVVFYSRTNGESTTNTLNNYLSRVL